MLVGVLFAYVLVCVCVLCWGWCGCECVHNDAEGEEGREKGERSGEEQDGRMTG